MAVMDRLSVVLVLQSFRVLYTQNMFELEIAPQPFIICGCTEHGHFERRRAADKLP